MSNTIFQPSAKGEEQEARNRLVERHLYLVNFLANRFRGRHFVGLDLDDLIQEGYIGLMRAAELFDPAKINIATGQPYHFSAYASVWIREKMVRALARKARSIYLPEYIWLDLQRLKRVQSDVWLRLQHEPSLEELAAAMEQTPTQVLRLLEIREIKSLDEKLFSDDDTASLGELLEAPSSMPEDERHADVTDLLKYLYPEERRVIICRYQLDEGAANASDRESIPLPYTEVARRLQMTRAHAQTVEKRALLKMRHWAERPLWEEARHVSRP